MANCIKNIFSYIAAIFDPNSNVSSKKWAGMSGWITVLVLICYGTVTQKVLSGAVDSLMFTSAGLLGWDSVTNIFKKNNNNNNNNNEVQE